MPIAGVIWIFWHNMQNLQGKAGDSWDAERYFKALDSRIQPVPIGLAYSGGD